MSEQPTEIKLHQQSRMLEITFDDGVCYQLPYELLRVYSPSADVSGHGPGQEVLQVGKKGVGISELVPVGSYAVQINFDDGHDTGLYTWEYLYKLGKNQSACGRITWTGWPPPGPAVNPLRVLKNSPKDTRQ